MSSLVKEGDGTSFISTYVGLRWLWCRPSGLVVSPFPILTRLENNVQIMGRGELAGEKIELIGHLLPNSIRILGHTQSPWPRTQVSCDLTETLRGQPLEEGQLSQVAQGQSTTGKGGQYFSVYKHFPIHSLIQAFCQCVK